MVRSPKCARRSSGETMAGSIPQRRNNRSINSKPQPSGSESSKRRERYPGARRQRRLLQSQADADALDAVGEQALGAGGRLDLQERVHEITIDILSLFALRRNK